MGTENSVNAMLFCVRSGRKIASGLLTLPSARMENNINADQILKPDHKLYPNPNPKADDTQSRFRRRKSAPKIGTEIRRRFFVPDAIWYAKKSAPKINMDDTKIDESISSMQVMVISGHDIVRKTFLLITGRRTGHECTRNRHKIEQATDRRQNLVPEKSGTRQV